VRFIGNGMDVFLYKYWSTDFLGMMPGSVQLARNKKARVIIKNPA